MAQLPLTFSGRSERPQVWSVSDLQRRLRGELERSYPRILVNGEVSNLSINRTSGHAYFTLKDRNAQLRCMMWRDNVRRLRFALEDGQRVIANGRITVYERSGQLQMSVAGLEVEGLGAYQQAYRQLAEALRSEGLTAAENKRSLPMWPRRIGVVTSPQAAALRDVLRTILRRDPFAHVIISPCPVQGRGASSEIAAAIARLDALDRCDVILVTRGGGSVEDLWAFNEEPVARAIVAARTPIVTGVGHETDTTIADLVADRAASTPTAAAELSVPVRSQLRERFAATESRLNRGLASTIRRHALSLGALESRLQNPRAMLQRRGQRIDELMLRAERRLRDRISRQRGKLAAASRRLETHSPRSRVATMRGRLAPLRARLDAQGARHVEAAAHRHARAVAQLELLSPLAVLARGYAVVTGPQGGIVRAASELDAGDRLDIRLGAGSVRATVTPEPEPDD